MDPPIDSGWSWIIMFASFFIQIAVFGLIKSAGVVYLAFLMELDVTRSDAAVVTTLIYSLSCILAPFTTILSVRFCHKYITFSGAVFGSVSLILAAVFYKNFTCIIVFYGIGTGIGSGLIMVPSLTIVYQYFDKHRTFALGFVMAGGAIGAFLIPTPLELILQNFNLQSAFLYMSAVIMQICPAALLLRPRKISTKQVNHENIVLFDRTKINDSPVEKPRRFLSWIYMELSIFRERKFILLLYSYFVFGVVWSTYVTFIQAYVLHEVSIDITPVMALQALTSMSVGDLSFRIIFGWISDRGWVKRKHAYIFFLTICGVFQLLYTIPHSYESVMALSVAYGIFISGIILLPMALIYDFVGPHRYQVALGICSCVNGITMLIAVPCLAYIREVTGSYKTCFTIMGLFYLSASLLWLIDEFYSWLQKSKL